MIKKIVLLLFTVLLATILVLGASVDDYKPTNFLTENWDASQGDIMYNFWHSLWPFNDDKWEVDPTEDADKYGWYTEQRFGLANWEKEICLISIGSDFENIDNTVVTSIENESAIYTTTVSVSAVYQPSFTLQEFTLDNLYEVSWYIHPVDGDLLYRVYLENSTAKEYFAGKPGDKDKGDKDTDWEPAPKNTPKAGFKTRYLKAKFDKVVLEYKIVGSTNINQMTVSVVEKNV